MKTLIDTLNSLFSSDGYFLDSEGNVIKEKIKTSALKMDNHLLEVLLSNKECESAFFKDVNGIKVFDKSSFVWALNNIEFLPSSYTSFKNKIGLIDSNGDFLASSNDVVLSFPFKDCVLEFDSTDENEKRDEIMLNEIIAKQSIDCLLSPKLLGNCEYHNKDGVTKTDSLLSDNLVIKGNNLIAMYSLLPRYENKVKLMYWDILYNTNNDLVPYNDSFKHSSWLTMMKNRIEVAKRLLNSETGFLLIQCDKNEDSYLTVLADEVFGRDHHICNLTVKSNNISGNKTQHKEKTILKNKDTILVYSMSLNPKICPQYTEKQKWDTHYNLFIERKDDGEFEIKKLKDILVSEGLIKSNESIHEDIILRKDFYKFIIKYKNNIARFVNSISPELKKLSLEHPDQIVSASEESNPVYAYNGSRISFLESAITVIRGEEKFSQLLGDLWTDIDFQNTQNEGGVSLPAGKKPEFLLQRILSMFTKPGDLVLDAYFGTGTTGAVALKMGRNFIGLEQLEEHFNKSLTRLQSVIDGEKSGISEYVNWTGGGSFLSCELLKDNQDNIDRIQSSSSKEELLSILDSLLSDPRVLNYNVDIENVNLFRNKGFETLELDDLKKICIQLLDKNILYKNLDDLSSYKGLSKEDERFSKAFYGIEE